MFEDEAVAGLALHGGGAVRDGSANHLLHDVGELLDSGVVDVVDGVVDAASHLVDLLISCTL